MRSENVSQVDCAASVRVTRDVHSAIGIHDYGVFRTAPDGDGHLGDERLALSYEVLEGYFSCVANQGGRNGDGVGHDDVPGGLSVDWRDAII